MKRLVLICVILVNIGRADTIGDKYTPNPFLQSIFSQTCGIQNTGQSAYKQLILTSQRVLLALQEQNPNMLMQALKEQVKSYQMVINFANQIIEFFDSMDKEFSSLLPLTLPQAQNPTNKKILEQQEVIQWFQEAIRSTQNNISTYQTYRTGEEFLRAYDGGPEFFLNLIQHSRQQLEIIEAELVKCDKTKGLYK